ncbi:MAG: effector-associated domain EAD1-containing protein [Candidatus Promineifilaceae bacterium]
MKRTSYLRPIIIVTATLFIMLALTLCLFFSQTTTVVDRPIATMTPKATRGADESGGTASATNVPNIISTLPPIVVETRIPLLPPTIPLYSDLPNLESFSPTLGENEVTNATKDPVTEAEINLKFPQVLSPLNSAEVRVDIFVPEIFQSLDFVLVDKLDIDETTPPLLGDLETHTAFIRVTKSVYVVAQSSSFELRPTFPDPYGGSKQVQSPNLKPGDSPSIWVWEIRAPKQPQIGLLTISVHNAENGAVLWNRNIEIGVQAPPPTLWGWVVENVPTLAALTTLVGGVVTGIVTYIWPIVLKRRENQKARPRTTVGREAFSAEIKASTDLSQLNDWRHAADDPLIKQMLNTQIMQLEARQKLVHRDLPNALIAAFDVSRFERMLRAYFDTRLDEITNSEDGIHAIIMEVIEYAQLREQLPELVQAARAANPDNEQLKTVADEILTHFKN